MDPVSALTAEHLEQRLTHMESALLERLEQRLGHLESLLIERFERRLADTRVDLLKWSFLFWVGQVAAIGGMLAFALRSH
jgi:hypothetical protein